MGRKLGGGCAPLGEGELGPRLTQCGQGWGLPARQASSWSVQPFGHSARTSQTDRQTGQTDRQRTDSIGRTVLQTVAQKLTETYWLSWDFSIFDNNDLSPVSVFDKFVFESEKGVLVLHLKDRFGSFVIRVAIIATANSPRIWRLLPRLNLEFSDFWPRKITALRMIWYFTRTSALGGLGYTSWLPQGVS